MIENMSVTCLKRDQHFVIFSLKMLQKCKTLTSLIIQIIGYASHEMFFHVQVLSWQIQARGYFLG